MFLSRWDYATGKCISHWSLSEPHAEGREEQQVGDVRGDEGTKGQQVVGGEGQGGAAGRGAKPPTGLTWGCCKGIRGPYLWGILH